jgi:hypothetical protein
VKGAGMAHGGYGKKKKAGKAQLAGRREGGGAPGVLRKGADKQKNKKTKVVSIKNQIRGIERLLKKVKNQRLSCCLHSVLCLHFFFAGSRSETCGLGVVVRALIRNILAFLVGLEEQRNGLPFVFHD